MKNKILLIIFLLFAFLFVGCEQSTSIMYIECESEIIIQSVVDLKVYYNQEELSNENLKWTISDYNVVMIEDGKLYANDYGKVTIGVIDATNPEHYCAKEIEIVPPYVTDIVVSGLNEVKIDKYITLEAKVLPEIIRSEVIWQSSDESILAVDNGLVLGVGIGTADIILKCEDFVKKYTITVIPEPTFVEVYGKNEISINEVVTYTYNIEDEVVLESSNNEVIEIIDNTVLGKGIGTAIITAYKKSDSTVRGTFEVTVNGKINKIEMTQEELIQIEEIINSMTVEELVGQMFNVGIDMYSSRWENLEVDPSTGLPYAQFSNSDPKISVAEYLKDYKFGNFIIKSTLGTSRGNLIKAISTLNEMGKTNSKVNPLITLEYNGGNVMNGMSALPANQSLAETNINTIKQVSKLFSSELSALGINSVLSVYANTNKDANNLLTTFGTNMSKAVATASTVSQEFANNNVIYIPDLSIYNNYQDDRSLEEIQATDFKLIEAAIQNGASIISVPLAVYSYLGGQYAFQNEAFIQDYLRKELGYNGVLMMDNSIFSTFVYDETINTMAVDAINKGIDMISFDITFTTSRWSDYSYYCQQYLALYDYIVECVNDGIISMDRIREAVARILLTKIRNNVIQDKDTSNFDYDKVKEQLLSYLPSFITVHGDLYKLDKNDNVLFISENYETTGTSNSLGDNLKKYASQRGYTGIHVNHTNTLRPEDILSAAKNYSKIIISVDSISSSKKIGYAANATNYLKFIEDLRKQNSNICFIFTGNASVKNNFEWLENYVLLYDFYEDDFASLCRVLTQESTPNVK